jgi:hypothetical protein
LIPPINSNSTSFDITVYEEEPVFLLLSVTEYQSGGVLCEIIITKPMQTDSPVEVLS